MILATVLSGYKMWCY